MMKRTDFMAFVMESGLPDVQLLDETRHRLLAEMAAFVRTLNPVPYVPNMVRNLLMAIGGDRSKLVPILRWVYEDGLYEATRGRKILAKKAQNKFKQFLVNRNLQPGRVFIPEDKLFFKAAWPNMAKRFTSNKIAQEYFVDVFMPWVVEQYQTKFEPKTIDLGSETISIPHVNKLMPDGVQKFQFGGPDGLIEYMENGDWSDKTAAQDPYGEDDPVRDGIDLRNPRWVRDEYNGKYTYKYAEYEPPMSNDAYSKILDELIKDGASQAQAFGKNAGSDDFKHEDDPDLLTWYRQGGWNPDSTIGGKETIGSYLQFGRRIERTPLIFEPAKADWIKGLIRAGIENDSKYAKLMDSINGKIQSDSDDDKWNKFFSAINVQNTKDGLVRFPHTMDRTKWDGGVNRQTLRAFINAGADALGVTLQSAIQDGHLSSKAQRFTRKINDRQYRKGYAQYDDTKEANIPELTNSGWHFEGDFNAPEDSVGTLYKRTAGMSVANRIQVIKKKDGRWYFLVPKLTKVGSSTELQKQGWEVAKNTGFDAVLIRKTDDDIERMFLRNIDGEWYDTHENDIIGAPIALGPLSKEGWQPIKKSDKRIVYRRGDEVKIVQKIGSKWHVIGDDSPNAESTLLGRSRSISMPDGKKYEVGMRRPHSAASETFGVADEKAGGSLMEDMWNNPQKYGDSQINLNTVVKGLWVPPDTKVPASIALAVKAAISRMSLVSGQDFSREFMDLVTTANTMLSRISNNPKFLVGDLDKVIRVGSSVANPDNLDDEGISEVKDIDRKLEKAGVTNPEDREKYVQEMKAIVDNDQDPRKANFPPEVFNAFLSNGFVWRRNKLSSLLQRELSEILKHQERQRELSAFDATGKDGGSMQFDAETERGADGRGRANVIEKLKRVNLQTLGSGGDTRSDLLRQIYGMPSLRQLAGDTDSAVVAGDDKTIDASEHDFRPFMMRRLNQRGAGLPDWRYETRTWVDELGQELTSPFNPGSSSYRNAHQKAQSWTKDLNISSIRRISQSAQSQDLNEKFGTLEGVADGIWEMVDSISHGVTGDNASLLPSIAKLYGMYLDPNSAYNLAKHGLDTELLNTLMSKIQGNKALSTFIDNEIRQRTQDTEYHGSIFVVTLPTQQQLTFTTPAEVIETIRKYKQENKLAFIDAIKRAAVHATDDFKNAITAELGNDAIAPPPSDQSARIGIASRLRRRSTPTPPIAQHPETQAANESFFRSFRSFCRMKSRNQA